MTKNDLRQVKVKVVWPIGISDWSVSSGDSEPLGSCKGNEGNRFSDGWKESEMGIEVAARAPSLLNSLQIPVERFGRRQIGHAHGQCSEDRRVSFGRLDLLKFYKFIVSISFSSATPLVLACRRL